MRFRWMFAVTATCLVAGLVPVVAWAGPSDPPSAGLLSEVDAVREARASGLPVVASALTDERTLVTADPVSGELTAVVSASVARVRDGAGGWRAPSARLVAGADGLLRPEAAVAQIAVSPGGSGRLLSVGDGVAEAAVSWAGALPAPVVDGATATYPEVFPGVDLVVRADVESAETFLVVKTAAAGRDPRVRSFSFGLSLAGLSVRDNVGGARSLVDAAGVERLVVPYRQALNGGSGQLRPDEAR